MKILWLVQNLSIVFKSVCIIEYFENDENI